MPSSKTPDTPLETVPATEQPFGEQPDQEEAQAPTEASEKVVKYVGTAERRTILKSEWASIGIEQDKVQWDASNGYTVRASELGEQALNYCDKTDDGFVIVGG